MKSKYRKFTSEYMTKLTIRHNHACLGTKVSIDLLNWIKKSLKKWKKSIVRSADKERRGGYQCI